VLAPTLCAYHAAMVANGPSLRLLPRLSEDNEFFWTAGADGVLKFLRCNACHFYIHPPGPICPRCLSRDLEPHAVSGRGRVETFSVNYQQWIPGSDPYIIAWVSIDEQPDVRLTTNLIDVEPDDVTVNMAVEVTFEHIDDVYVPLFRPVGGGRAQ
jgi:uncharacterized OB-fold protein